MDQDNPYRSRRTMLGGMAGRLPAAAIAYAREVAQRIRAEGRKAVTIPGDIKDEAFCKRLVADAKSRKAGRHESARRGIHHDPSPGLPPAALLASR